MKYFYRLIIIPVFLYFVYSCSNPVSNKYELLPPDTHLSVFTLNGDTVAPGSTVKKITWWGDSPNGFVVGFRISFDSLNWGYTTNYDSTFVFTINGQDSTFRIWVAAVDNNGLVDPTPASNLYPVVNSNPTMVFDNAVTIPDTVFPIATFKWIGTDPDGDFTIRNYYWSLNDTNHFKSISGSLNLMTLTKDSGLVSGNYCLYMKAVDNAGAFSPIVRYPQDSTKFFKVLPVNGRVLLIKDMPLSESNDLSNYISGVLDTVQYSVMDIKANNGALIPKIINPMFIETLKLFKVVLWYGNRGGQNTNNDPNFSLAQLSLPYYLAAGGKVIWSSGIPDNYQSGQGTLFNFAPVDSIKSNCFIQFNFPGDTLKSMIQGFPELYASQFISTTRGVYNGSTSSVTYKLIANPQRPYCTDDSYVGIIDSQTNPKIILLTMPIYYLNGSPNNSKQFYRTAFSLFGLFSK